MAKTKFSHFSEDEFEHKVRTGYTMQVKEARVIYVKDQSRFKEIRAGMVSQGGKNPGTKEKPF